MTDLERLKAARDAAVAAYYTARKAADAAYNAARAAADALAAQPKEQDR